MALSKNSRKWKDEEEKQPPEVCDNNQERHLLEFRNIKELPCKANKWTGKRDKLQENYIKSILEDISCQKF